MSKESEPNVFSFSRLHLNGKTRGGCSPHMPAYKAQHSCVPPRRPLLWLHIGSSSQQDGAKSTTDISWKGKTRIALNEQSAEHTSKTCSMGF